MTPHKAFTGSTFGHFVSLEGDSTAISAQLRQLPSSSDILIIPPLSDAVSPPADDDASFNVRSFLCHVHRVASERVKIARSFLQSSSHSQPRLVLANGGCLSARSICLSAICEKVANGNIGKAENLFLDIVKDGITGLVGKPWEQDGSDLGVQVDSREAVIENQQIERTRSRYEPTRVPIKSLNRANCGGIHNSPPNEDDIELGGSIVSASSMDGTIWETNPTPIEEQSGGLFDRESELLAHPAKEWENFVDLDRSTDTFGYQGFSHQSSISTFADAMMFLENTEGLEKFMLSSPWLKSNASPVISPQHSELEKPSISGSQPFEKQNLTKRVWSFDNLLSKGTEDSDMIPSPLSLIRSSSAHCLGSGTVKDTKGGMVSNFCKFDYLPHTSYGRPSSQNLPQTVTTTTSTAPPSQALSDCGKSVYNSLESGTERAPDQQCEATQDLRFFEPVFGIAEDLIILFVNETRNELFDYVVSTYKDGIYPGGLSLRPLDDSLRISTLNFPSPPVTNIIPNTQSLAQADLNTRSYNQALSAGSIYNISSIDCLSANRINQDVVSTIPSVALPTVASQPLSRIWDVTKKFYEVKSLDQDAFTDVQNCLRSLLSIPPLITSNNPGQSSTVLTYNALPKLITNIDEAQRNTGGPINRMLALGCDDGIDQHFYRKISRHIERLWYHTANGAGIYMLDIRDPIINAMQAFTSQPLSRQAGENPFSQQSLLAELIVPHLESYRSMIDPRELLILQYPPSYLPTIIALRDLLGSHSLHVAGIVDTIATPQTQSPWKGTNSVGSPKVKTSIRSSNRPSVTQLYSQSGSNQSFRASNTLHISFSKADFLLPSTATEYEILTFISSIRKKLMQNYSFYTPDTPFHTSSPSSSTMSSNSSHPPYTPASPRRTFFSPRTDSLIKLSSPSYLNNTWSGEAARTIFTPRTRLEQDWDDFYLDDSEIEDELERIFMPQPSALKRDSTSSNKAMKWLGLT